MKLLHICKWNYRNKIKIYKLIILVFFWNNYENEYEDHHLPCLPKLLHILSYDIQSWSLKVFFSSYLTMYVTDQTEFLYFYELLYLISSTSDYVLTNNYLLLGLSTPLDLITIKMSDEIWMHIIIILKWMNVCVRACAPVCTRKYLNVFCPRIYYKLRATLNPAVARWKTLPHQHHSHPLNGLHTGRKSFLPRRDSIYKNDISVGQILRMLCILERTYPRRESATYVAPTSWWICVCNTGVPLVHLCVRVCVSVCEFVCVCMRVCVCVCVREDECVCVCVSAWIPVCLFALGLISSCLQRIVHLHLLHALQTILVFRNALTWSRIARARITCICAASCACESHHTYYIYTYITCAACVMEFVCVRVALRVCCIPDGIPSWHIWWQMVSQNILGRKTCGISDTYVPLCTSRAVSDFDSPWALLRHAGTWQLAALLSGKPAVTYLPIW